MTTVTIDGAIYDVAYTDDSLSVSVTNRNIPADKSAQEPVHTLSFSIGDDDKYEVMISTFKNDDGSVIGQSAVVKQSDKLGGPKSEQPTASEDVDVNGLIVSISDKIRNLDQYNKDAIESEIQKLVLSNKVFIDIFNACNVAHETVSNNVFKKTLTDQAARMFYDEAVANTLKTSTSTHIVNPDNIENLQSIYSYIFNNKDKEFMKSIHAAIEPNASNKRGGKRSYKNAASRTIRRLYRKNTSKKHS